MKSQISYQQSYFFLILNLLRVFNNELIPHDKQMIQVLNLTFEGYWHFINDYFPPKVRKKNSILRVSGKGRGRYRLCFDSNW